MNKMKRLLFAVIILLASLTAIFSAIHLSCRTVRPEGQIVISIQGREEAKKISSLELTAVSGDIINGKGESRHIDGEGLRLSDIIGRSDFSEIEVIADDEYRARVSADEIEKAWLLIEGTDVRLLVFGDRNAKRDVKHVARLEVK